MDNPQRKVWLVCFREGGLIRLNPFRFLRVMGFYNPFAVIYFSFRILTRFLVGRRRRDNFLRKLRWETLSEFLDWMRLPESLSESFMVEEVGLRVKRKYFRHEPAVSSFLLKKHGRLFIDIGANVGYYSFLLHDNFDTILAIEPHPRNIKLMEMVKEKYDYNKVKTLSFAVSDKDEKTKLYLGSHRGGHSLLSVFPYTHPKHRKHITLKLKSNYLNVNTIALDSLLETCVGVDLVKVDVEGVEWKVLNGAKNVMDKIKSWLIELHDLTRKNELEKLLESYGYNVIWVDYNHLYARR